MLLQDLLFWSAVAAGVAVVYIALNIALKKASVMSWFLWGVVCAMLCVRRASTLKTKVQKKIRRLMTPVKVDGRRPVMKKPGYKNGGALHQQPKNHSARKWI